MIPREYSTETPTQANYYCITLKKTITGSNFGFVRQRVFPSKQTESLPFTNNNNVMEWNRLSETGARLVWARYLVSMSTSHNDEIQRL